MPTEFDDSQHYGFFMTSTALTSGKYVRFSELVLAGLRAQGIFDNLEDGTTAPTTDKLWLDKNTDPAVLKTYDSTAGLWRAVTFTDLFGDASAAVSASAALAQQYANTAANLASIARSASEASGNVVFYETYAAANQVISEFLENQIVEIFVDETKGNLRTRYRVESGALVFKIILSDLEVATIANMTATPDSGLVDGDVAIVTDPDRGGLFKILSGTPAENSLAEDSGTVFASDGGGYTFQRIYYGPDEIKWYGALGDGVDDDDALQAAMVVGRRVHFSPGTYVGTTPIELSEGTYWFGDPDRSAIIDIPTDNTQITIYIPNSNCGLENFHVNVNMTTGMASGVNGTICTVGLGTSVDVAQTEVSNIVIRNVYGTNNGDPCNAFTVIGRVSDITLENVGGDGFLQGVVVHWGSHKTSGGAFVATYNPNNIKLDNLNFDNIDNHVLFVTGCYDVRANHVRGRSCGQAFAIIPGDAVGDSASINDEILTGISISDVYVDGCDTANAIFIDGEGLEPNSGNYGRVKAMQVTLEDIYVSTSSLTGSVMKIEDAFNIVGENIHIQVDSDGADALEIRRCSNIEIVNFQSNSENPIVVDRSQTVTITGSDLERDGSGSGSPIGIEITGTKYEVDLTSDLNISDTSISIDAALPIRAYAGDRLVIDGTENYVVISEFSVGTQTTFDIESSAYALSSGGTVYLDVRAKDIHIEKPSIKRFANGITDQNATTDCVLDVTVSDGRFALNTTDIDLAKTTHPNIKGNVDILGAPLTLTWTPTLVGVTYTADSAVGRAYIKDGICHFEMNLNYSSLNTADTSAVRISGLPIDQANYGFGHVDLNVYESNGFSFAATDTIRPVFWSSNNDIVFADASGTLNSYNSGEITAAGDLRLTGNFFV